jgi:hypothetical protein
MVWLSVGCADVLDLTERRDAIEQLCACSEEVPQFDGRCVELLSERLERAVDATRAAWLEHFAATCGGSEGVCPGAYACYAMPGTCAALSCTSDIECCGYLEGATCGSEGLCQGGAAQGQMQ